MPSSISKVIFLSDDSTYVIKASADANGSIFPHGTVTIASGSNQSFIITPNTGYHIDSVFVDGSYVGNTAPDTLMNVTENHTIGVKFAIDSYTITSSITDGNGTISPLGTTSVNYGGSQVYTTTPKPGFRIETIVIDDANVDPFRSPLIGYKKEAPPPSRREPWSYSFENVHMNHSIVVTFVPDQETYSLTITSESGGIIAGVNSERPNIIIDQPDPSTCQQTTTLKVAAAFHESKYFAIIPAQGYDVDSIIVDGKKFERRPNELGS